MLTVLQMLPALESGGVEKGTLEIAGALVSRGHRSLVMSAGGRLVAPLTAAGSEHYPWPVGRKSLLTFLMTRRLRRFLREQQVDIIHVRSRMPGWVAWLAWRGMDPRTRPRLVTTVHGFNSVNRYSAIMARGERVIAVSECIRDYVLKNYPMTDPARITVIHRGVDRSAYPYGYTPPEPWLAQWKQQYPQLRDRYVITLPGRLTRLKGHMDFLDTLYQLRQRDIPVHGLIVGEPPARRQAYVQEIRQRIDEMQLKDHVTLTGHRSDLREVMCVSDLVLSLSKTPESFGRTTLEALSLGRPVIGYDHGGVGEQLGALYPMGRIPLGDTRTLADRIAQWAKEGAPAIPQEHGFTLDSMVDQTLSLYASLHNQQSTE
ncbi:MAG: glycosyltransferase family 4 protein [Thioalkalivibrio sp.]